MKFPTPLIRWVAVLAFACGLTAVASANIIVSGNVDQDAGSGTFQITSQIDLTVTTTGDVTYLAFPDWVTSDGNSTHLSTDALSYQINGGGSQLFEYSTLADNLISTFGDLGPGTGYFFLTSTISVTAGDMFSLLTGSVAINNGSSAFNSQAIGTYTGNVVLADSGGTVLATSAVPEPATYAALVGLAALGMAAGWRRRCVNRS